MGSTSEGSGVFNWPIRKEPGSMRTSFIPMELVYSLSVGILACTDRQAPLETGKEEGFDSEVGRTALTGQAIASNKTNVIQIIQRFMFLHLPVKNYRLVILVFLIN